MTSLPISCEGPIVYVRAKSLILHGSSVPGCNTIWVVHNTLGSCKITVTTMHHALFKIHDAVVYIHHKGLLHRDLNPSNVFFSREGGSVKVGDFGLVAGVSVDVDTTSKQV